MLLYSAVPMAVQRVANVERAQLLVECPSRPALQRFLAAWQDVLHALRYLVEGDFVTGEVLVVDGGRMLL